MAKRKAMTSDKARKVRNKGHLDALEFAKEIGIQSDYKNNPIAKKDVVDFNGDTHSIKSGEGRWQIFLYARSRFENDNAFQSMNGIGQLLIQCLSIYPNTFEQYQLNKQFYKEKLREPMRLLCEKFQEKRRVKTFIEKSFFDGNQVDYLTIKYNNLFHIFHKTDIVKVMGEYFVVTNSKAIHEGQTDEQKVIFKYNDRNVGELEIRNSGKNHYKEVLFVMNKIKVVDMLLEKIPFTEQYSPKVLLYGQSAKLFNKKKSNSNK